MREWYAIVRWAVDDVLALRPDWSRLKALEFLQKKEEGIKNVMVHYGWEIIETTINDYEREG